MDSFASELGTKFAVRVEAKHVIKKDQVRSVRRRGRRRWGRLGRV